jgi:hypothetical protein
MLRMTVLLGAASLCAGQPAFARQAPAPTEIVYNHAAVNANQTFHTTLRPSQDFSVTIQNTCPTQFDYRMYGVPNPEIRAAQPRAVGAANPLTSVVLRAAFDAKFGSYLVEIRKKAGAACTDPGTGTTVTDLKEVTLVVAVTPLEWEIGQDAAFTLSLKSPRVWTTEAVSVTGAGGANVQKFKVVRDSDHEDPVRVNFVTMTHFYGPTKDNGLSLGFGLVDNNPEYYFGWSWGLGPRNRRVLNVTAGAVLTPVTTLPDGIHENDLLDSAGALKDFKTNHAFRAYVGFTATFFKTNGGGEKPQAVP